MLAQQIRMQIGTLDSRGRGRCLACRCLRRRRLSAQAARPTLQTPLVVLVAENKMQLGMAPATGPTLGQPRRDSSFPRTPAFNVEIGRVLSRAILVAFYFPFPKTISGANSTLIPGAGWGDLPHDWSTGCFCDAILSCILFSATRLKVAFATYFSRYR
jgi:hypothetical protein